MDIPENNRTVSRALTIAGLDPSGGAGLLADARTFAAFGFEAVAAITSITFQNSNAVFGAVHQTAETVRSQLMPLIDDGHIACAKTGMLPTSEVVKEVARLFRETEMPAPVVDPVMISSSGHRLMVEGAVETLIRDLFPVARLVTPNAPEAETLTGLVITSEAEMREAAVRIRASGARAVLIKGGHLEGEDAIDLLDDDGTVTVFRERRIPNATLRGSGCILSAAIAAGLGGGKSLNASVGAAKAFVLEEIRRQQRA